MLFNYSPSVDEYLQNNMRKIRYTVREEKKNTHVWMMMMHERDEKVPQQSQKKKEQEQGPTTKNTHNDLQQHTPAGALAIVYT